MTPGFDLKYAWRLLRKSWGYSLMCAAVVALSVGLAVFAFTLAYSQLWKPLGLPDSDPWYSVQIAVDGSAPPLPISVDAYTYQELLKSNRSVDFVGAFASRRAVLSEGQASTSLRASPVSPRLLAQVKPLLGRTFRETDSQPGATPVAILSYETWQNFFAADPGVVGKITRIDAAPAQIVGVMMKDFYAFADFEIWLPLQLPILARPSDARMTLSPLILPRQNQDTAALQNEMNSAVARVNSEHPELFNPARHLLVIPGRRMLSYSATPIIVLLITIPVLVMLLGSVNISMVFLARLLERSRELALRTALGASRPRLLRQCLVETGPVVFAGLIGGWGLAVMFVRWTQGSANAKTAVLAAGRVQSLMLEFRPVDLLAAVVFAVAIWLLSTLIPAWRIVRQDPTVVLAGSGKGSASRGRSRSAGLLVGVEVVVSCVVLVVCTSIVLAVRKEVAKPSGLQSAAIIVPTAPTIFDERYAEPVKRLRYWEDLAAAIESRIPGADLAFASAPPSKPNRVAASIETAQRTGKQGLFTLPVAVVSENYFQLLGLRLRKGRLFDTTDGMSSLKVAIVDDEMAARYWPGQDVLGKRIQLTPTENGPWLTVVGVVSPVAGRPYRKEDIGVLYQPLRQAAPPAFHLLARLPNTVTNGRVALRAAAYSVDRDLPLNNLQTLDDYMSAMKVEYEALVPAFTTLAFITALIAASGLFGLITRSVARRTQEVGIRRALGATARRATSMFMRQGAVYLALAVVGVALGILVMPAFSRGFTNIFDYLIPVTFGAVLLMAAVIFTASYIPSRRAIALEPGDALRYD